MLRTNTVVCQNVIVPEVRSAFASDVADGLSKPRKSLPCRYFYDKAGSELFEEITRLPEYYPTRMEAAILSDHAREMTEGMATDGVLVEFGSGSSLKTEILLRHLSANVAYVPIDVSSSALTDAKQRIGTRFPLLKVYPVTGNFSQPIALPPETNGRALIGFFPGSTVGNLTHPEAVELLSVFRNVLTEGGRLIIGVDLKKDARKLVLAYNDSAGVTAAFNLNILARINRELGGAINIGTFRHEAIYDPREGRIEMHLVSKIEQDIWICNRRFHFGAGESIHTENSYKYTIPEFQELARRAGWQPTRVWTDDAQQFSVHELMSPPSI